MAGIFPKSWAISLIPMATFWRGRARSSRGLTHPQGSGKSVDERVKEAGYAEQDAMELLQRWLNVSAAYRDYLASLPDDEELWERPGSRCRWRRLHAQRPAHPQRLPRPGSLAPDCEDHPILMGILGSATRRWREESCYEILGRKERSQTEAVNRSIADVAGHLPFCWLAYS